MGYPFLGGSSRNFWISVSGIFVSALLYAYGILTVSRSLFSAVTVFFLLSLICIFLYNILKILRAQEEDLIGALTAVVVYSLTLHLAMVLGFYLSGRPEVALWVEDSYSIHIPGAVNLAGFIHGKEALSSVGVPLGGVFLTQALAGISFFIAGVSPFSSAMTLMVAKLLTTVVIFHLGKMMVNVRVGAISALIYAFSPTVLYYTTAFYKEAVVQLLVASILLFALKVFLNPGRLRYWLLLFVSLALMLNERFYMFFFFIATFIPLVIVRKKFASKVQAVVVFALLIMAGYAIGHKAYELLVKGDTTAFVIMVKNYRLCFLRYPDVSSINWALPYPLAVVKIVFTPFFTPNKFTLFSDYSYILIWGSFLNQAVILFSVYGMYKSLRSAWTRNWFLILPFLFFIGVFAYLAPYNGRLRDGFYPIISIYAAYAVSVAYAAWQVHKSRRIVGAMPDNCS